MNKNGKKKFLIVFGLSLLGLGNFKSAFSGKGWSFERGSGVNVSSSKPRVSFSSLWCPEGRRIDIENIIFSPKGSFIAGILENQTFGFYIWDANRPQDEARLYQTPSQVRYFTYNYRFSFDEEYFYTRKFPMDGGQSAQLYWDIYGNLRDHIEKYENFFAFEEELFDGYSSLLCPTQGLNQDVKIDGRDFHYALKYFEDLPGRTDCIFFIKPKDGTCPELAFGSNDNRKMIFYDEEDHFVHFVKNRIVIP